MLLGGGGKKTGSKKRPRSLAALLSPPLGALPQQPPQPPQPPQPQGGGGGGVGRGSGSGGKRRKRAREEDALLAPWTVVPVAERDILVDRCRKEIAPLLGGGGGGTARGIASASDDEEEGGDGMDVEEVEEEGKGKGRRGGRRRRRRDKGRTKAFSAKDGTAAQRFARAHLAVGLNDAMRALEKGELALLFLCRDVKPAKVLEPAAVLAHLKGVPFFVLPKAAAALGEALGLRRAAALGFKRPGAGEEGEGEVAARLDSFLDFVLAKREHMTNAPLA